MTYIRFALRILFGLLLIAPAGFSLSAFAQPADRKAQPYFTEPAISPDGSEIAFVSGGDIWTVAATGGEARLLVSHPANELRRVDVSVDKPVGESYLGRDSQLETAVNELLKQLGSRQH